jgi:chaperone modulatory protein CbpM
MTPPASPPPPARRSAPAVGQSAPAGLSARVSEGHALARVRRADAGLLDLEAFARSARLHPDLVRRLVALGLLECDRDAEGRLWFRTSQLAALARVQRLRAGFSLNYAALGLVIDLLDRIAELEAAVRRSGTPAARTSPQTPYAAQARPVSSQPSRLSSRQSSQQSSQAASKPIGG